MAAVMSGGGGGGGGGGLGLMSCVRESSPTDIPDAEEIHHHETKKRRFHPLRGLRRMFRRKSRPPDVSAAVAGAGAVADGNEVISEEDARCLDARSRSAGQLQGDDAQAHSRNSANLQSGLSVSHDSIFSPEQRSAGSQSESELESSSSLSMQRLLANTQSGIRAELLDAVRRRRMREEQTSEEEEEEDLGLPRSPFSGASSTTTDILIEKVLKENTNKSSHSTCSDGSLLSMGSSEMDEDSYGPGSRHSSKLSLQEKKSLVSSDASPSHATSRGASGGLELGGSSAPLSHSAAKHKMAVRPKRTYGAPRRSRMRQVATAASLLPVTPELNEDGSARSVSPDPENINGKEGGGGERVEGGEGTVGGGGVGGGGGGGGGRLDSPSSTKEIPLETSDTIDAANAACMMTSSAVQLTSAQLKSASLPLGMTAPGLSGWSDPACKLSRSKSSATDRKQPLDAASVVESEEELSKKEDTSFFGRLLSRRSGKKKKNSTEEQPAALELPQKRMDDKGRYVQEPPKLTRNHPATRQRVEPISIPSEPCSVTRMHVSYSAPTSSTIPEPENPSEDHHHHHQHIFKPTNRVIPDDIDLELQRRSLVKKSHSFRLTTDTAAPKSLDPTILISNKSSSSVILSSSPPTDAVDTNSSSDVVVDDKIGALNRNLVDGVTSDVSEIKSESCSSVYIKSVLLPCCPDNDNIIESVSVEKETKHTPTKAWDDEITVNNESLPAPLSHQITIPVNASVVSIVDTDKVAEKNERDCLEEVEMDIADLSDEAESSVPTSPVKPEPRQKTPDDLTYFPVPAPRISKRESTPVEIPEFMKVQLNRFDGRKLSNVILSTSPNTIFKQDHVSPATSPKTEDVVPHFPLVTTKTDEVVMNNVIETKEIENPVDDKSINVDDSLVSTTKVVEDPLDECGSNDEKMNSNSLEKFGNKNIDELEVEVNVSPVKSNIDNTPKVVELKQWSSNTTQVVTGIPPRPVPNPRYSIVSITASKGSEASNQSSDLPKNQTAGQIVRKKSIVKDVHGVISEQNHRKTDQDRDMINEKDNSEAPVSKPIPRKKSFNTDEKSGVDNVGGVSQLKQTPPPAFTKHNNRVVENRWNRKSSFEEFNDRIVGEQNGKNRSKDDENVRERNSIGSCDALSMQDSSDVVMRRKPLSREVTRQNDDEPELLKVFARRSLKVKDCDLPSDLEIAPEPSTKSRDSDKENECGDSPPEERKKIKEAFVDTKDSPKPSSVAKTQKNILSATACEDASDVLLKENNQTSYEKRQRSRTFPDNQKILEPPKRPVAQRVLQDVFKEKDVEVISLEANKGSNGVTKNGVEVSENNNNSENDVPLFKRIQQRKEEWEKRAQLAAVKRNHP